jgi:hypothetical protein
MKSKYFDFLNTEVSSLHATQVYGFVDSYSGKKETPWPLVRKQTILTEPPPLVGEVNTNFYG